MGSSSETCPTPSMQPRAPQPPLVTTGACSPARTHCTDRSLAHCFAYSPLVPKHSPATMHAARYSYLSLTSAGVASDLPFVTLRGNKQGLARVGKKQSRTSLGFAVLQMGGRRSLGRGKLQPQPGCCMDVLMCLGFRATSSLHGQPWLCNGDWQDLVHRC